MKAALFCTSRYIGDAPQGVWPVPNEYCDPELAEQSMAVTMEQFRLADVFGFDWVTVAEHHFSSLSLTPNPMIFAGALSQVVKRAKIAVLGPSLPTLNPVRVAEEFAMLDAMTGGRLIAGLMRGTPNEYVTYNFNPSESRARFAEALEIIRRAWTEPQPFGWQGRYYQYRSISIWPRPVQRPHPPIYMSGSSPEAGEFAAEQHIGLGFAFTTIAQAAKASAYYQAQCREQGWEPTPDDIIYRVGFHVAETDEEAFDDMSKSGAARRAHHGQCVDQQGDGRDGLLRPRRKPSDADRDADICRTASIRGSSSSARRRRSSRQIERIRKEIGAGILDCPLAAQLGDKTLRSIELFGTKVLPRIREL